MRMKSWVTVGVVMAALAAWAGEPGGPPDGGNPPPDKQGRPPGGRPGRRMFGGGGMFDPTANADIFDGATKALDLNDKAKAAVGLLNAQFDDELQAATAELRLKMAREYVAMVLAVVPDDQKPKYEAVAKALVARDEAIAAAQKDLKAVLDKVRANQVAGKAPRNDPRPRFGPPGGGTVGKADVLRTHFILTDEQDEAVNNAQREAFGGMGERMQAIMPGRPGQGGPPDPAVVRQIAAFFRQVRDEADEAAAKAVAGLLTDAQKQDYTIACAAIDACKKAAKDAEDACRKTIVAAVGDEKADALLGPLPGKAAPGPTPAKPTTF